MERKTAFFDMDGTIVAPVFYDDEHKKVSGFLGEDWSNYCNEKRERAYMHCALVEPVVRYAERLKDEGWDVKVLTIIHSDGERVAKGRCIWENGLEGLFSDIVCVKDEDEKLAYMRKYAKDTGTEPRKCLLVEDNLMTVLRAAAEGFSAMHLSHIVTGSYNAVREAGIS